MLLIFILAYGIRIYSKPHLRLTWRKVINRPLNMTATIILLFYIVIGLLDTIHLKASSNEQGITTSGIVSVLDKILAPMALHSERTYSAPFAIYTFTKEAIEQPNGTIIRDYQRLLYGGVHLSTASEKWQDIKTRLIHVLLQSIIIWSAFSILICVALITKRHISWEEFANPVLKGNTIFPWRSFFLSIGGVILFVVFVLDFMPYYHILGTSQVGEDVLFQTLKSIRTGLIIGSISTLVTLPFAIIFGIMAGYYRGWVDDGIQYVYTTLSSIPGVLLIASAVLTLQLVMGRHSDWFVTVMQRTDARLLALCAILGITSWTSLCRLLRGETLKISQMDYIQAAHSLGVSNFSIILKHLLPNVFHIILITIALDFSGLVLAEAVLSYVGVGVDPASYSWGTMINSARLELARVPVVWWSLTAAFIFMFILVLAANIFSDGVRDAFDPRTQYIGIK